DLKQLKVSDEISVRCTPDAAGQLVALKIWAGVVQLTGTVKELRGEEIEIQTAPGDERRTVYLSPDTAFGANRADLAPGKQVRIVGLDIGNGAVEASRVALFNTDLPVSR